MKLFWIKERVYQLEDFVVVTTEFGSNSKNFDGESDTETFTFQPYQFGPRIDSDKPDNDPDDGMSGDESDTETTNPRQQNSDWYASFIVVNAYICCH